MKTIVMEADDDEQLILNGLKQITKVMFCDVKEICVTIV